MNRDFDVETPEDAFPSFVWSSGVTHFRHVPKVDSHLARLWKLVLFSTEYRDSLEVSVC